MKLLMSCMKCFQEFGKPTDELSFVEFCDDGRYEFTCSHGHKTITLLQQQKFEILFEIGAYAILDGYYREAVSSFTSSLERFYEFCVKVFMINSISVETFESCWKKIANQSERQLGAYIFLWAFHFKEYPNLLSTSQTEFRNKVIHKGKIPTNEEALKYGNVVLGIVRPQIKLLKDRYPEEVQRVVFNHLRACQKPADADKQKSTMGLSTIVSLSNSGETHLNKTLEESIEGLNKWRQIIEG